MDAPFPWIDEGFPDFGIIDVDFADGDAGIIIDVDFGPTGACGDNVLTAPEQCDDGNTDAGDGCDGMCLVESDVCPGGEAPRVLLSGTTLSGDTTGGVSAASGSCGGGTAGEDTFVFTVYEEADVVVTTDLGGTLFNTAVYVRADCADRGSELGCGAAAPAGDTVTIDTLPPGTYFAIVDGAGGEAGMYEVGLTIAPRISDGGLCDPAGPGRCVDGTVCSADAAGEFRCRSPGSLCADSAMALTLGAAATDGSTVGGDDFFAPACSSDGDSPERVFRVTVPAGAHDLVVTATPTNFAADMFDIVLTVETMCGVTSSAEDCSDRAGASSTEEVVVQNAVGDYFILVDGFGNRGTFTEGDFEVQARLRDILSARTRCDPAGDLNRCADGLACGGPAGAEVCVDPLAGVCASATVAALGVAIPGTVAMGADDLAPSCARPSGTDETLYFVDLTAPGFLSARVRGMVGGATTVYIRGADGCGPADDLACDTTSGMRLEAITGALTAGRYYIVVDGTGAYTLTVGLGTIVAAGAVCDATSTTARCAAGTACVGGTCRAVTVINDVSPNAAFCDAQGPSSGDTLFVGTLTTGGATDVDTVQIDLASPARLDVSTSDGSGGCIADTLVEVYDAAGSTCAELDAAMPMPIASDDDSGIGGICSSLTTALLPAGTYYVRVRRAGGGVPGGNYELLIDVM